MKVNGVEYTRRRRRRTVDDRGMASVRLCRQGRHRATEGTLVWINERYYAEGVDLGYFDGFTMRMWSGSDDCSVTDWAPIERAAPPREVPA
jgi:hypothetical protein